MAYSINNNPSIYTGTVDESNRPHGYGRSIDTDGQEIQEGQFKNGKLHGFQRHIINDRPFFFVLIYEENSLISNKQFNY